MKVLLDELINMATQEEETEHKIGRSNKMNIKLTKKAKEELLKLVAGEITKINFTEMAVGDGLYTVAEATADIVALKSVRIKTKLGNIYEELVGGSSQLFITSTFFNKDVEAKFEVREVAIYAKDNATDEEYLYAYYLVTEDNTAVAIVQDKTTPQYLPISVNSKLSNIDEANIALIDDILVVNQKEFQKYKEEAKTYADDKDKLKSDITHDHNLTDIEVKGILPLAKGGTGSSTGSMITAENIQLNGVIFKPVAGANSGHLEMSNNGSVVTRHVEGMGGHLYLNWGNKFPIILPNGTDLLNELNLRPKYPNYNTTISYSGGHTTHYAPADGWIWFELHGIGTYGVINNIQVVLQTTPYAIFTPPMPIRAGWTFRGSNISHFYYNA